MAGRRQIVWRPLTPELENSGDWAAALHQSPRLLLLLTNRTADFYTVFRIPKRNGGERLIEAPAGILKCLQRQILDRLLSREPLPDCVTAFRRGGGIVGNAAPHRGQRVVLKMDIERFFPSLRSSLVLAWFSGRGYTPAAAVLLTRLCTLRGHLPQGAPTSPALANLLLAGLDETLSGWCAGRNFAYTRYADDLTVSGNLDAAAIREGVALCRRELSALGLRLNRDKIAVRRAGVRQQVTGLVVNRGIGAPREMRREFRRTLYFLSRYGEVDGTAPTLRQWEALLGTAGYLRQLDPNNAVLLEAIEHLRVHYAAQSN